MKTYKQWTEDDNEKLKGLYPDPSMSVQEIAKQLGRTTNSIKGQAFNLGLRRPYRGTWTETENKNCGNFMPQRVITKKSQNIFRAELNMP